MRNTDAGPSWARTHVVIPLSCARMALRTMRGEFTRTEQDYPCSEPTLCPRCGARRQYAGEDWTVVHARAGTVECPPQEFSEDPALALLAVLRSADGRRAA